MLNKTFDLSPNYLFTCIFGESEFNKMYLETRGFFGMKHLNRKLAFYLLNFHLFQI